ncbi:MAG TPA: hypothetical protein VF708_02950 [Pyrinomonadaceae bacterium]|jgi:hypothetical protein
MSQPDEQLIRKAAEAAINDLQLDCRVEKVYRHPNSGKKLCIRFSGDYGKFCDEFRNASGEENSLQLMREKVKSHFIKMRKSVRIRRGSNSGLDKGRRASILPGAPLEIVGQALDQTTRLVGEVVNQVSDLARSALESEAVVSVDLPAPVQLLAPPPTRKSKRVSRAATKKAARSSSAKTTGTGSSRASKSTSKTRKKAAKKAGSKKHTATSKTKRSSKKRL